MALLDSRKDPRCHLCSRLKPVPHSYTGESDSAGVPSRRDDPSARVRRTLRQVGHRPGLSPTEPGAARIRRETSSREQPDNEIPSKDLEGDHSHSREGAGNQGRSE
ncbi:hypothetical protein BMF94_3749 [Rhodotorula taiwanensis]|uniref:Uncharacterized protein n=1 Tax=Rhodotorula taiwanensis TaxID=741276 RepID=A0A2S5B9L5_9BASI|nr:hypothetical protein BMF94_3749 [Rhodotorula taiwanensis]